MTAITLQILRLASVLGLIGDVLSGPAQQSSARWRVMDAISERPLSVAQVGRMLGLSRQGVQRLADLLVRDHLAHYLENPSHKRAKLIELLPAGILALHTIRIQQRRWANRVGESLNATTLRKASAVLTQVEQVLANDMPAHDGSDSKPTRIKRA